MKKVVRLAVGVVFLCGILKLEPCWGETVDPVAVALVQAGRGYPKQLNSNGLPWEVIITTNATTFRTASTGLSGTMHAGDVWVADDWHFGEQGQYLVQAGDENQMLPAGSTLLLGSGKEHNAAWVRGSWQKIQESGRDVDSFGGYLGYDRIYSTGMIGATVGYAQSISKQASVEEGHINFLSANIHGIARMPKSTFCEYGAVGSVNDHHHAGAEDFTSYTVDPHLNFGYDWTASSWCILEPFVSTDFVFNFQNSYSEPLATGILRHHALNSGLFRLEPGLNLYGHWRGDWGTLILREKVGYVRKQPMYGTSHLTYITTDFTVDNVVAQNFFTFSSLIFARMKQAFITMTYRGEWGSGVTLNEVHGRLGYYF